MFARDQTFRESVEKLDELGELTDGQFAASSPPGLRGFDHLIDRAVERALLISLRDGEDDLCRLEATNATNAATREQVGETGVEVAPAEIDEVEIARVPPPSDG